MCAKSNAEIAAWLKARQDLREIESELAGLERELKQTGESLRAAGQVLVKTPGMAGKIDTQSLSETIVKAAEKAKRYRELVAERADKHAEIDRLDLTA